MKVNDSQLNAAAAAAAQVSGPVTEPAAKKAIAGGAAADQARVSDLSSRVLSVAAADSPERAARIARLTAEVRAGRYEPDAARTARGILDQALSDVEP